MSPYASTASWAAVAGGADPVAGLGQLHPEPEHLVVEHRPGPRQALGLLEALVELAEDNGHIGALTLRGGIISAAFCWAGFVITTMVVNNGFARRDARLLLIDGGHWLIVLLLIGAIIGGMGP